MFPLVTVPSEGASATLDFEFAQHHVILHTPFRDKTMFENEAEVARLYAQLPKKHNGKHTYQERVRQYWIRREERTGAALS